MQKNALGPIVVRVAGHTTYGRATLAAMPRVTYDSQSFSIDGRRIWVLGGSVHYARVPAEAWADRIAAAAQAGLNTIETVCPWALHESRKGRFNFTGQADVRRFVELCTSFIENCPVVVDVGDTRV